MSQWWKMSPNNNIANYIFCLAKYSSKIIDWVGTTAWESGYVNYVGTSGWESCFVEKIIKY